MDMARAGSDGRQQVLRPDSPQRQADCLDRGGARGSGVPSRSRGDGANPQDLRQFDEDLFHEGVSDAFISAVWEVMRETPQHNYQILTKRPERMCHILDSVIDDVLPNVWLGTSVEDRAAVLRIDMLREVPAAIRFISFEPLVGPVGSVDLTGIDWAIVGGESGRAARPLREAWIDEIHHQCVRTGTLFFFKQWGTGQGQQAPLQEARP